MTVKQKHITLMNNFLHNKHLLARAGFGIHHNDIEKLKTASHKTLYQQLKSVSDYKPIGITAYQLSYPQYQEMAKSGDKKPVNLYNKNHNAAIGKAWQDLMINSQSQLREKMALFWHGHFATRIQQSLFNLDIINIFRKNAFPQ